MNTATSKALNAFLGNFEVATIPVSDGGERLMVVDRSGDPAILTFVAASPDGTVRGGRRLLREVPATRRIHDLAPTDGEMVADFALSDALAYLGFGKGPARVVQRFASRFRMTYRTVEVEDRVLYDAAEAALNAAGQSVFASRWINPDLLGLLESVHRFDDATYAFFGAEGEVGTVRRQALAAYPLFANELRAKVRVKLAIDNKTSPVDALSSAFGANDKGEPKLSRSILKKLAGKRYGDGGLPVPVIVEALSRIPADWFPKDEAEWNSLIDLTASFFRQLGPEFDGDLSEMTSGASGRWAEFANRVAKSFAPTQPPQDLTPVQAAAWKPVVEVSRQAMEAAANQAREMLLAFRNLVLLPVAATASYGGNVFVGPEQLRLASDAAARILFGGKSLPAIMELQRHWQTQHANILNATAEAEVRRGEVREVAEDGWAPICDTWVAPNGVTIYPLTDPREIEDEGAGGLNAPGPDRHGIMGLGHCVGSYTQSCRSGQSHIVSFRIVKADGSFTRLSTAEFEPPVANSDQLKTRQHRGRCNGQAPEAAVEAFNWFLEEVAEQRIPLNRDGMMSYLAGRRVRAEEIEAYSGYDWREPGLVDQALAPWAPYLPKRMRGFAVEDLRTGVEMRDLVESLVPTYSNAIRRS